MNKNKNKKINIDNFHFSKSTCLQSSPYKLLTVSQEESVFNYKQTNYSP